MKQAEEQNAVLKKPNGDRYKYIEPLIIAPKKSIGSTLDFDNDRLNELIQIGRQRAEELIP